MDIYRDLHLFLHVAVQKNLTFLPESRSTFLKFCLGLFATHVLQSFHQHCQTDTLEYDDGEFVLHVSLHIDGQ